MKKYWVKGFIMSIFIIWLISACFIDSITAWVWDPVVNAYVVPGGMTYYFRSEGWGVTHIGEHGLIGTDSIKDIVEDKVVIWGDSYVEALHVPDQDKMAEQFNILCDSDRTNRLYAISVGRSGKSVADYYFNIPQYEKVIAGIRYHCIILGSMDDLLPDQPASGEYRYVSFPAYQFTPVTDISKDTSKRSIKIKQCLNILRLQFIWNVYRDLFLGYKNDKPLIKSLRFKPGPNIAKGQLSQNANTGSEATRDAFTFAIDKLKKATKVPVVFIYCPAIPYIKNGAIQYDDKDSDKAKLFAGLCAENNIHFINLEGSFIDFYKRSKKLPRGFSNTFPGGGHLNKYGHKLVAGALLGVLKGKDYAIHSN